MASAVDIYQDSHILTNPYLPRSVLNQPQGTTKSSGQALGNRSVPELMVKLRTLLKKKKEAMILKKENISKTTKSMKPSNGTKNKETKGRKTPFSHIRSSQKSSNGNSASLVDIVHPVPVIDTKSVSTATIINSNRMSPLIKAAQKMQISVLNNGGRLSNSTSKKETSHTIIIAQTANIMSPIGSQSNKHQSKTDVNGPVYVENRTNISNSHNYANSARINEKNKSNEMKNNQNNKTISEPQMPTSFYTKADGKDEIKISGNHNQSSILKTNQTENGRTHTFPQNKENVSKSISRRSLRNRPNSRTKPNDFNSDQMWKALQKRFEGLRSKFKRDASGNSNGDRPLTEVQFDLLLNLVQMIKEFKEYQALKAKSMQNNRIPTTQKPAGHGRMLTTQTPIFYSRRTTTQKPPANMENYPTPTTFTFYRRQGMPSPTKVFRKTDAHSKISSARDLMASSFNYISEPIKASRIKDVDTIKNSATIVSHIDTKESLKHHKHMSEFVTSNLGNSVGTITNQVALKSSKTTVAPSQRGLPDFKRISNVKDVVLNPSYEEFIKRGKSVNEIYVTTVSPMYSPWQNQDQLQINENSLFNTKFPIYATKVPFSATQQLPDNTHINFRSFRKTNSNLNTMPLQPQVTARPFRQKQHSPSHQRPLNEIVSKTIHKMNQQDGKVKTPIFPTQKPSPFKLNVYQVTESPVPLQNQIQAKPNSKQSASAANQFGKSFTAQQFNQEFNVNSKTNTQFMQHQQVPNFRRTTTQIGQNQINHNQPNAQSSLRRSRSGLGMPRSKTKGQPPINANWNQEKQAIPSFRQPPQHDQRILANPQQTISIQPQFNARLSNKNNQTPQFRLPPKSASQALGGPMVQTKQTTKKNGKAQSNQQFTNIPMSKQQTNVPKAAQPQNIGMQFVVQNKRPQGNFQTRNTVSKVQPVMQSKLFQQRPRISSQQNTGNQFFKPIQQNSVNNNMKSQQVSPQLPVMFTVQDQPIAHRKKQTVPNTPIFQRRNSNNVFSVFSNGNKFPSNNMFLQQSNQQTKNEFKGSTQSGNANMLSIGNQGFPQRNTQVAGNWKQTSYPLQIDTQANKMIRQPSVSQAGHIGSTSQGGLQGLVSQIGHIGSNKNAFSWTQANNSSNMTVASITPNGISRGNKNSGNNIVLANINKSETKNTINSNTSNVKKVSISNTNVNSGSNSSSGSYNPPFVISATHNVTIIHKKSPDGGSVYHIVHDTANTTTTKTAKAKKTKQKKKKFDPEYFFDLEEPIDYLQYLYSLP